MENYEVEISRCLKFDKFFSFVKFYILTKMYIVKLKNYQAKIQKPIYDLLV